MDRQGLCRRAVLTLYFLPSKNLPLFSLYQLSNRIQGNDRNLSRPVDLGKFNVGNAVGMYGCGCLTRGLLFVSLRITLKNTLESFEQTAIKP